ncbi:MAG: TlpA family protein disulfide reductase [Bdellovibrionales bacterium]|nr:TlpA family protein disulfide reductase [Bdellovibrionales bacterium]
MSEKQKIVHSILAAFEYLVFVGCLCVGVAVSYANALEIGDSLPALTVTGEGGERISLDDYSGKVVYLDVWASWCKTCRHSLPWMDGLQRRFGSQGLQILAVNVDEDPKDAQKFLESSEVKLLVGYDPGGKIPAALRVQTMPTSYLIGRDGKLKAIHGGLNDERMKEIEKEIEELISQKGEG